MDALRSLSDSLSALAAQAGAKVFHVPSPLGGRTALGFDGSRLLVPAAQAAEGEAIEVLGPGGKRVSAKVVGFDGRLGLAVLELAEPWPSSAWVAAPGLPPLGSLAIAVAYPSPQGPEMRLDAVRFSGGEGDEAYIQTDGPRFPGFAGAALVDPEARLAGFVVSDAPGNRAWAIPGARAAELVRSIAEGGFRGRAWLGLSALPVEAPSGLAERFGDDREGALIVAGLEKGGPAERAGLLVGDLLVSIGGVATADPADLRSALETASAGAELSIVVLRAGERKELKATPTSRGEGGHGQGRRWRGHHGWGRGCGCDEGR